MDANGRRILSSLTLCHAYQRSLIFNENIKNVINTVIQNPRQIEAIKIVLQYETNML